MENNKVQLIEDDEVITLTAEDGTQVDFYEIAVVEHEDELYAILEPADSLEDVDEGEVLIFKIEETDEDAEDDVFTVVEDEELLQAVFDEYMKAVAECNSEDCSGCSGCKVPE